MEEKTCCVTGHRDIPDEQIDVVKYALRREIVKAVSDGYTGFMTGFANGADQYFAEIVLELQSKNPGLKLIAALPYRKRMDSLCQKEHTNALLDACAEVIVIQEEYRPNVYAKRNRYMVEHSDRVIAVYDGREKGGTVKTIRFAHQFRKELREIPVGLNLDKSRTNLGQNRK
ncbi:SLOG family protein [Enterocloster clostridioformis]